MFIPGAIYYPRIPIPELDLAGYSLVRYPRLMEFALVIVGIVLGSIVVLAAQGVLVAVGVRWVVSVVQKSNIDTAEAISATMGKITEGTAQVMRDGIVESIKAVTESIVVSVVGKPGEPVPQAEIGKEGDMLHPAWFDWHDQDTDLRQTGVGDSVWVPRPVMGDEDRTAPLADGEAIIPGVPLPDMTGEGWTKP